MRVCVALISGTTYDPLYARLADFTRDTGIAVDVAFTGDHPALNNHLAGWIDRPGGTPSGTLSDFPYDLVSTHTKYFPSQLPLLAPLDDVVSPQELSDFAPMLLDMVRLDGRTYGLPRNIDVRLLHHRTDLVPHPPATWDALLDVARQASRPPHTYGFLFPGKESGLFGTFYELAEMGGAHLFPADLVPQIENDGGRWALNFLRTCYREGLVPPELTDWHFDRVHDFFRDGHAAMVGDWPGYYGDYRNPATSAVHDRIALARYPAGPSGKRLAYGGGHTFALTRKGAQSSEALALLRFLTAPAQQLLEARNGSVPVRQSVMQQVQAEATPQEKARWEILEQVIAEDVLIPPKFASYPRVEEVLWVTVQAAMVGRVPVDEALHDMTRRIEAIVKEPQPHER
jgi:multiple sugar transport system substrate-binding protein